MRHEATIRLVCFFGVFALMAMCEWLWLRRDRSIPRLRRWPNNLAVVFIDTPLARVVLPAGATGVAFLAEQRGWGLFNHMAGLGGTNVTSALTNSLADAFSVEYTTNLLDWLFLGPATPRYGFTDTNAPAEPQRYYRLRWP